MAVTTDNIRDLLNRPRGLVEGAISEYISLRTTQVDQIARNANYILPEGFPAREFDSII